MPVTVEKGAYVDSGTGAAPKVERPSTENPDAEVVWGSEGVEIHGRHTTEDLTHEDGPTGAHASAIKRTRVEWPGVEEDEDDEAEKAVEPKAIKAPEVEDKSIGVADAETA